MLIPLVQSNVTFGHDNKC